MTRYIFWDFSLRVFLALRQVCAILLDFATAKTASANAYAFKLRCAFVHASLIGVCLSANNRSKTANMLANARLGGFSIGWIVSRSYMRF
ncbi:hypothetical protein [Helicobacter pylori]|uniref:hypothetical protein n=1 Tax=Helicobacter pylori TaxID=210 RepID=UPI00165C6F99|nr:hypothetical protein [Helicobacter pylori]